ncbi:transcriptional regulatory [Fusarium sp. NRRL 25303]|nr:transcriptional regulatory [Fusarium sp. NRRL 25303]
MPSPIADRRKARSKNGCLTCRIRKVKCDEQRPVCKRCENSPNKCEWLEPGQALSARGKRVESPAYGSPRLLASSESPASFDSGSPVSPASGHDFHLPRSHLSAAHIPLANSLQLSEQDRSAFAYIPYSTMVVSYGKLWQWSNFSYIYANIANVYPGVMRSFIAVANMELRAKELLIAQEVVDASASLERASRLAAAAAAHYTQALKDLSSLLDRICQTPEQDCDIDALFTMWFLILRYLDADSATGNMNSGQFCLDFLSRDAHDYISHEHLFLSVRSALPKMWGEQYPISELLDDMENYRPLRLYHLCQGSKLELLRLARSTTHGGHDDLKKLWRHVENFGDEFVDILLLAKKTPSSGGKRLMWTVYAAALDFHALQILCSSLDTYNETPFKPEPSLSYIFSVATKALEEDPRQVYRFMWSLSVALSKTNQTWLSTQLAKARVLLPRFGVPGLILEQCGGLSASNEGAQ